MKLFKKRQKENVIETYHNISKQDETIDRKEDLLEEYTDLNEKFKIDNSEETRLRMVQISEELSPKPLQKIEKKPFKLFKRKQKYEEKYCHTCKHNLTLHHKKGRSTGCKKCGCLRTIEEIMNPTDNGHGDSKEINTT